MGVLKTSNSEVYLEERDFLGADARASMTENANVNRLYMLVGKRLLDIAVVIGGLPFVLPVMLIIAILVKLDGGPVLYSQPRIGRNGKVFKFWKFRSMVVDADKKLMEHLRQDEKAAAEWHVAQKLKHDPRITSVGKFIRKTSLDELPQLYNVICGEMSLVGPRPMMPDQRKLYFGEYYEKMLPGLSGLWQVSARNDVSFGERARYDTEYFHKVSLSTDISVLAKTFGVVLRGSGV